MKRQAVRCHGQDGGDCRGGRQGELQQGGLSIPAGGPSRQQPGRDIALLLLMAAKESSSKVVSVYLQAALLTNSQVGISPCSY